MTVQALPNLKHLPFGGAGAVVDIAMQDLVRTFVINSAIDVGNDLASKKFVDSYVAWVKNSQLNCLQGLDAFPVRVFSNGTSEAFDKFYMKNHQRRFRCFRGEYMYHVASWKHHYSWAYVDQDDINANDALVLSLPFSDLGDIHPDTNQILDQCAKLGVPVLIDCAFFGLCSDINFNLDHPAVTDITFSLSKTAPVASLRIGMRLTRTDDDDSLLIYNKTNYTNNLSASVGIKILDQITADWNWQTWHKIQQDFCKQLSVKPSRTVIFGIAEYDQFREYNRGGTTNRLCFYRHLEKKYLTLT